MQRVLPHGWLPWLELILATPVVLWGGWPFFQRGWTSVVNRSTNMFTLIAHGHGRGVRLQPGGDRLFRRCFPRRCVEHGRSASGVF